jgi:cytochrome c biogenesis protein CcmG/thiol:disulfide interchange protein DsbE
MQRHPSTLEPAVPHRRRNRWVLVGGVLGGVALLTMLLAFGLSRDPTLIKSPLVGRSAPDFSLQTLNGTGAVQLSRFSGQVVVINFWASWCTECRVEHPALMAAWDRYRDQGVVVLGIAFGDRTTDSKAYLAELGGDWPQLADPGERTALAYGVYGVPETFVIGPDGRVAYKRVGGVVYGDLTDVIERLLPGRQA